MGIIQMLIASGGLQVALEAHTVSRIVVDPADAYAGLRLNSSGIIEERKASYTAFETWLLSGAASDYEVRATLNTGSLTSGTTGTWLSCGTSREWLCSSTVIGISQATLTIEIRRVSDSLILESAAVSLYAEVGL
jgi:hypothetical protein